MLERLGVPEERYVPFIRDRKCLRQQCLCDVHGEVTCLFSEGEEPHCPQCQESFRNAQADREMKMYNHKMEVQKMQAEKEYRLLLEYYQQVLLQ